MTPPPIAVDMSTAAKLIGKSRWVIQGFIREGLPFIRTGKKHKMIVVSTFEAWLKAREVTVK